MLPGSSSSAQPQSYIASSVRQSNSGFPSLALTMLCIEHSQRDALFRDEVCKESQRIPYLPMVSTCLWGVIFEQRLKFRCTFAAGVKPTVKTESDRGEGGTVQRACATYAKR